MGRHDMPCSHVSCLSRARIVICDPPKLQIDLAEYSNLILTQITLVDIDAPGFHLCQRRSHWRGARSRDFDRLWRWLRLSRPAELGVLLFNGVNAATVVARS